jgi:hypothetical protein
MLAISYSGSHLGFPINTSKVIFVEDNPRNILAKFDFKEEQHQNIFHVGSHVKLCRAVVAILDF